MKKYPSPFFGPEIEVGGGGGGLFPFFVVACVVKELSDKVGLSEQNYKLKETKELPRSRRHSLNLHNSSY